MKGICFKEPLFHLTVQGIKTQTRRIIKSRTGFFQVCSKNGVVTDIWQTDANEWWGDDLIPVKPRYEAGETVYLKEPYHIHAMSNPFVFQKWEETVYKYGEDAESIGILEDELGISKWKNKLFMPESKARYFIKITDVRAERLQGISEEDCIKEGIIEERPEFWNLPPEDGQPAFGVPEIVTAHTCYATRWFDTPQEAYAVLIDGINGKGTWENNPWVWVYDYELEQ